MKKILLCLAFFALFATNIFAQNSNQAPVHEKDESKWSDMTYVTVPILKILEAREAYVVIYQKNKIGTSSVIIPKKWAKGTADNPRKLKTRLVRHTQDAYMTVVKKNGEFARVILSFTKSKSNPLWGVVDYRKPLDGIDKDTLEELEL